MWIDEDTMTKAAVWAALAARGATTAVVEFSGGNDEGGADAIRLCDAQGKPFVELSEWDSDRVYDPQSQKWVSGKQDPAEGRLARSLAKPVYDRWGSFAGEFYVSGTVTWTVATQKVTVTGYEEVRHDEPFAEEY